MPETICSLCGKQIYRDENLVTVTLYRRNGNSLENSSQVVSNYHEECWGVVEVGD
jgi:hypothetical protein